MNFNTEQIQVVPYLGHLGFRFADTDLEVMGILCCGTLQLH